MPTTKKRHDIRLVDVADNTLAIIRTHAKKEKRSMQAQATLMIEELIRLKKMKPCK